MHILYIFICQAGPSRKRSPLRWDLEDNLMRGYLWSELRDNNWFEVPRDWWLWETIITSKSGSTGTMEEAVEPWMRWWPNHDSKVEKKFPNLSLLLLLISSQCSHWQNPTREPRGLEWESAFQDTEQSREGWRSYGGGCMVQMENNQNPREEPRPTNSKRPQPPSHLNLSVEVSRKPLNCHNGLDRLRFTAFG